MNRIICPGIIFFIAALLASSWSKAAIQPIDSLEIRISEMEQNGDTNRFEYLDLLFENAKSLRAKEQLLRSRQAYLRAFEATYNTGLFYDTATFWSAYEYLEDVAELYNAIAVSAPELFDSLSAERYEWNEAFVQINAVEYTKDGKIRIVSGLPKALGFTDEVITLYGAVESKIESERELAFIDEADIEDSDGPYTTYIMRTEDTSGLTWKPRPGDLIFVQYRSRPIKGDHLALSYLNHTKFTTNYKAGVMSMALLASKDYPHYRKIIYDCYDHLIDEVTEFVSELTDTLQQGLFTGMDMTGAFQSTGHEEIDHFLRFIYEHPFNYMSKPWKFSETYATWVLNKAPLSKNHYRDFLLVMPELERQRRLPEFTEQIKDYLSDWVIDCEGLLEKYEYPKAVSLSQLTLELAGLLGEKKVIAEIHRIRYEAYSALNQDQRASSELSAAMETYRSLGDEQGVEICRGLMSQLSNSDEVEVVIQAGHNMPFITTFHPSGKFFYTGGWDGFLKMWDTKSGLILKSVKAHDLMIEALEVSEDGRFVLTCEDDGEIKIFNARTLQLVWKHQIKGEYVNNIDINKDGSLVAYTTGGKVTYVMDVESKEVIHKLKRHTQRVTGVHFHAANEVLFTCSKDSFIYTWKTKDFSERGWYKEGSEVHGVVASPDGSFFATIRRDTSVGIWDFHEAMRIGYAPTMFHRIGGDLDVCSPSFSANNRFMTYISPENQWNIVRLSDRSIHTFNNYSWDTILHMIWHPKELYLLKNSSNMDLVKYDLSNYRFRETGSLTFVDNRPSGTGAYNINFDTSGKKLILYIRGEENLLTSLDLENGERKRIGDRFYANPVNLFVDEASNWIEYVDFDGFINYRDQNGRLIKQVKTPITELGAHVVSEKHGVLIEQSKWNGRLRIFSLETFDTLLDQSMPYNSRTEVSYAMEFDEKRNQIYASSGDRFIYIYDRNSEELSKVCLGKKALELWGVLSTKDGDHLVLHTNRFVGIFDKRKKKVTWKLKVNPDKLQYTYLAISDDMKFMALGDYYYNLKVIEVETKKEVYAQSFSYFITALRFHPDLPYLVVCSEDPMVQLINYEEKRTALTFYPQLDGGLVMVSNNGEYWAAKDNLDGIAFRYKNNVYPVDQFDLYYNKPAKVLSELPYSDPDYVSALDHASVKRLEKFDGATPELGDIALPNAFIRNRDRIPALTEDQSVDLYIECSDFADSVTAYQISVNGVPIYRPGGKRVAKTDVHQDFVRIPLGVKSNVIKVWSYNSKGYQSLKESVEINRTKTLRKPDLYIGVISVSDYADDDYDLKYPVKDAGDFVNELQNDTSRYRNILVQTLFDSSALRSNLGKLREFYSAAEVEDQVILFVSGHGLLDEEMDFYFGAHDMNFEDPAARGITYSDIEDLLTQTDSRQRLLLMDACHSGEVDKTAVTATGAAFEKGDIVVSGYQTKGGRVRKSRSQMGLQNSFNLMKEMFADVGSTNGIQVISAASGDSYALESDEWKNGVFTYSILKGLRENAADRDGNGRIYVSELRDYVIEEVFRQTDGKQRPTVRSENIEFDFRVK